MKTKVAALALCGLVGIVMQCQSAITFTPFGPHGEGGSKNGQTFTIGSGGSVFEMDAFLSIAGLDLNGTNASQVGTSAELSKDALPAGLNFSFKTNLSPDKSSAILTYAFTNTTSSTFSNVKFFVLLDAEIDQAINTFFNEYGTVSGTVGHGAADGSPDLWQIDQPGFPPLPVTLFGNLLAGTLDNTNAVPASAPNDVAMALGFSVGDIGPGGAPAFQVMVSDNGNSLGSLALVQHDRDTNSKTFITLSAGLAPALSGAVFVDANTNKLLDAGEGLANVNLLLLTNGVAVVTNAITDANGRYSFNALPGNYSVQVDATTLPANLKLAPAVSGSTANPTALTLIGGVPTILNWAYVPVPPGIIAGSVFVDAITNNGVVDPGEGLANISLVLLTNGVTVVTNATTDANGAYSFSVPGGTYSVRLNAGGLPAGVAPVPVNLGTLVDPAQVTAVGGAVTTLNWGFAAPALVVRLFVDQNNNTNYDTGEPLLPNVAVTLLSNNVTVAQVPSDASGVSDFGNTVPFVANPAPGTYTVSIDPNSLPGGVSLIPGQNTLAILTAGARTSLNLGFVSGGAVPAWFTFTAWTNNWATGSLLGKLMVTNPNGVTALEPLQLVLTNSANFYWASNELSSAGLTALDRTSFSPNMSIDVTAAVHAQHGGPLEGHGFVILTNNIPVFSRARLRPPDGQFGGPNLQPMPGR